MAKVRSIRQNELQAFSQVGIDLSRAEQVGNMLGQMWANGDSKPDWCFVLEEKGRMLGRVLYWSRGEGKSEFMLMGLHLPWAGEWKKLGGILLEESWAVIRREGAEKLTVRLSREADDYHAPRMEVVLAAGMELIQEKLRYRLSLQSAPIPDSGRLTFKSLPEVGEAAFASAMARVTAATLDSIDTLALLEVGPEEFGRRYFTLLKDIHNQPDWWQLAYDSHGTFAGLIVPQRLSENIGTLNYIGVPPEQRGNGYVHDLTAKGLQVLWENDVTNLIADTDLKNLPAQAALEKAGFQSIRSICIFQKTF